MTANAYLEVRSAAQGCGSILVVQGRRLRIARSSPHFRGPLDSQSTTSCKRPLFLVQRPRISSQWPQCPSQLQLIIGAAQPSSFRNPCFESAYTRPFFALYSLAGISRRSGAAVLQLRLHSAPRYAVVAPLMDPIERTLCVRIGSASSAWFRPAGSS